MYSVANLLSKGSTPSGASQPLNLKPEGRAQTICLIAETLLAIVGAVIAAYGIIHGLPIAAAVGGGIVGLYAIDHLVTLIIRNVRKHLDAKREKPQAPSLQQPEIPQEPQPVVATSPEKTIEKQRSELTQKLELLNKQIDNKTAAQEKRIKERNRTMEELGASQQKINVFLGIPEPWDYKTPEELMAREKEMPVELKQHLTLCEKLSAECNLVIRQSEREIAALEQEQAQLTEQLQNLKD